MTERNLEKRNNGVKDPERRWVVKYGLGAAGALAADELLLGGAVRKKAWELLTSPEAKEVYADVANGIGNLAESAIKPEHRQAANYVNLNAAPTPVSRRDFLTGNFGGELRVPESLPFDKVIWNNPPFSSDVPRIFNSVSWPNVKRWAELAYKHSNIDYLGTGKTLAQTLREQNLDETVILSQIWQESGGDPNALNPSGFDTGLGQVVSSESGFAWAANRPTRAELLNPEVNMEWIVRILSSGIAYGDGTVKNGVQRYAGLDKTGYADMIIWLNNQIKA